ncbi:hypothetical protein BANRA_05013 [Escherichia coli]|nr:hypothetical protein BANRA_05013 [Escherichia coli]
MMTESDKERFNKRICVGHVLVSADIYVTPVMTESAAEVELTVLTTIIKRQWICMIVFASLHCFMVKIYKGYSRLADITTCHVSCVILKHLRKNLKKRKS